MAASICDPVIRKWYHIIHVQQKEQLTEKFVLPEVLLAEIVLQLLGEHFLQVLPLGEGCRTGGVSPPQGEPPTGGDALTSNWHDWYDCQGHPYTEGEWDGECS